MANRTAAGPGSAVPGATGYRAGVDPRPARPGDEPDWQRPSGRLRVVRRVQVAIVAVPVTALGVVVTAASSAPAPAPAAAVVVGVAAVVVAVTLDVILERRVGSWRYAERQADLLVKRGLLVRRLSMVPYGRMQYIDVIAGPVERSFGLATLHMHTAAAASNARIPGLPAAQARALRDHLAVRGESQAAGL